MLQLRAASLADTHQIAGALAGLARPGDMVVLSGEMGAGKTAFAQGFGRALGVTEPITSPTFTLVHSYDCGKITLHHADLYRLERTTEVAELALGELAEFNGIVLVEWGDVVESSLGDHLVVHLEADPVDLTEPDPSDESAVLDAGRSIELTGVGSSWAARWPRITTVCEVFRC
ncbi:MAG: tRNA (adenosine(37)-N6)-threonylcarbamoyltransferase complex ATPase subunit type 1 TsaE [Ilumatobacteraceae bacterium]